MYNAVFNNGGAGITVTVSRLDNCDKYGVWVWRTTNTQSYRMTLNDDGEHVWQEWPELAYASPFVSFPGPIFRALVEAIKDGPDGTKREQQLALAFGMFICDAGKQDG